MPILKQFSISISRILRSEISRVFLLLRPRVFDFALPFLRLSSPPSDVSKSLDSSPFTSVLTPWSIPAYSQKPVRPSQACLSLAMAPSTTFINARLVGSSNPTETYTVVVDAGGTISSIETTARAAEPSKESKVHDLRGELYLAPSLVDFHTHFTSFTLSTRRLDLYECRSLDEVVAQVKPYVEEDSQRDVPFIVAHKMRGGPPFSSRGGELS